MKTKKKNEYLSKKNCTTVRILIIFIEVVCVCVAKSMCMHLFDTRILTEPF